MIAALAMAFVASIVAASNGTEPGARVAGDNRMFFADVRFRGPLDVVWFDCGDDGETRLAVRLVAGEERTLSVPLPVNSPLGAESLASVPLPSLRWEPEDGAGAAAWLGWTADQPAARFARFSPALRARSRPVAPQAAAQLGTPEFALAIACFLATCALRRRPWVALVVAGAMAGGLFALAVRRGPPDFVVRVHEIDIGVAQAYAVETGRTVALPSDALEVAPVHAALVFELERVGDALHGRIEPRDGAGSVQLAGLSIEPVVRWNRAAPAESLGDAWVRSPSGRWTAHGEWVAGRPLGPTQIDRPPPPGWLVAGLAPGRGVLLGRLREAGEGATFVRVVGF